jgi:hypothetical protein
MATAVAKIKKKKAGLRPCEFSKDLIFLLKLSTGPFFWKNTSILTSVWTARITKFSWKLIFWSICLRKRCPKSPSDGAVYKKVLPINVFLARFSGLT